MRVPARSLVATGLLAGAIVWLPAALLALHDPWAAAFGVPDLGVLVLGLLGLAAARPEVARTRATRIVLVGLWAVFALFGLAWAASLVATEERLPFYDLLLLTQPVSVFVADLYGSWAPWAIVVGGLGVAAGLLGLTGRGFRRLAEVSDVGSRRLVTAIAGVAVVLGTMVSGPWTPRIVADLTESIALRSQVQAGLASRSELATRSLTVRPDVRLYVVESYGDVLLEAPIGDAHRALLAELDGPLRQAGWFVASGRAISPTHGGRSWLADATVLTGIEVARQATFGHVTRRGRDIPSLPRFFAERGYATVLVRPKDRARPGVRLVNHFGFETTVFHDELAYDGPAVGWGHVPDQFTVEVVERDVLAAIDRPRFAFVHLATSHYPWGDPPPLLDDARDWQSADGDRGPVIRDRTPLFALQMTLSRYRGSRRALRDRYGSDLGAFQALVGYDLQLLAQTFAAPTRPTLMLWYGDHQPPFLAEGQPADSVVHVLATDPEWLRPFLDDGFRTGLDPGPRQRTSLHFRDLFERITRALGDPARRGGPPGE
ncbi:MAG: sulfatase-like hydrolase/transferase [Myxococcota bacterium]